MRKDPLVYLEDIINSISHIEKYTKEVGLEEFKQNEFIQNAVIRRFQIIGEATKRIPEDFKQKHSDIPWRLLTGTRDILVHDYDDVNFDRLWKTIKEDLPILKNQINTLSEAEIKQK